MIIALRILFIVVIASMLAITTWASLHTPLFSLPREIWTNPWFLATLLDAYWAFITFYVWVAWKEQSALARILWLPAILALGNFAMAAYMLAQLFQVSANSPLAPVFTQRNRGALLLPGALTAGSIAVYLIA